MSQNFKNFSAVSASEFPKWPTEILSDAIFTKYIFSGMTIDAVNEKFHHSDHCWVVDEQDVLMLMANL